MASKGSNTQLTELVLDRAVDLVADTASDERDRYDRVLAYVETDGTDIGAQLISEGLVSAYWPTSSPRPDRGADYVTIETEARDTATGSWAVCRELGRSRPSSSGRWRQHVGSVAARQPSS